MASQTVTKLQEALNRFQAHADEALLVFILVQVRKLLELSDKSENFRNLRFHCDWALHARLYREGARNFLAKIDKLIGEIGQAGIEASTRAEAESLVRFDLFLEELKELLTTHALPTDITEVPQAALRFLNVYVSAIENSGLEEISDRLNHVKSLHVMSIREETFVHEGSSLPVTFLIFGPDKKPIYRWHFTFATGDTSK